MREILFRGKQMALGVWVEGDFHKDICDGSVYISKTIANNQVQSLGQHIYLEKVFPETVGQYTGLTDKNGTKIFEGDILSGIGFDTFTNGVVMYGDGKFAVVTSSRAFYITSILKTAEVIGNIHDNPKLLGESHA